MDFGESNFVAAPPSARGHVNSAADESAVVVLEPGRHRRQVADVFVAFDHQGNLLGL
jgi:hypothetical protein